MLEGIQPVISVAQNAIKDILNETQPVPVTIEKIVGEVSRTFNVSPADIRGTKRNANVASARRVMKAAIDEHLDQNIGGYDLVFVARGMTPRLKSWQLSEVVARLFAQAGLPDKAKQPGAKPPATVPPADRAAKQ